MTRTLSKAAVILLAGAVVSVVLAMLSESQRNRVGVAWGAVFSVVAWASLAAIVVRWAERLQSRAKRGMAEDGPLKLSLPDYTTVRVTRLRPEVERQVLGFASPEDSVPQIGDVAVIVDRDNVRSLYVLEKVRGDGSTEWLACFAEDEVVPLTDGQAGE